MPSIAASLALNDAFSQRLVQINGAVASTLRVMENLNSQLQAQISLRISVFDAVSGLDAVKQQLAALSTTREIQVSVNTSEVLQQLRTIRQQISTEYPDSIIGLRLDVADISTQAAALRRRIEAEMDGLVVRLRIELPTSLTAMFTNLQQLVLRLIRATRQLRTRSADAAGLQRALERIAALERQVADLQSRINSQINNAGKSTSNWLSSLKGIVSAYLSLAAAKKLLETADDMSTTNARLGMVNDGLRTQAQLQQQVMDAANETRANYQATADLVTKLGMSTQGIFKTDDDIIDFTKSFNKALVISGAGAQETTASILQMGQALGSGVLQGDELRSLSENAPALMSLLAEGLGVARGQLKQMGADGELTSEMIVKAFKKQSDKIDKMFEQMPMTFGSATTILKNKVSEWVGTLNGVGGPISNITQMVQDLTAWLSTDAGAQFLSGFSAGITTAANILVFLGQVIAQVYSFMSTNWPTIEPIVWGLVAGLVAWKLATIAAGAASVFAAINTGILTAAVFFQTLATGGLRLAWAGLNATMKANVIIMVITLIAALIVWVIKMWQTSDKAAAFMYRAFNSFLNFFSTIPAYFWEVVEGMMHAFKWWAGSIGKIYDIVINSIIDGINKVLSLINKVTGSSYEITSRFNFEDVANDALDYAGAKKDAAYADAAAKAKEREAKVQKMLDDRTAKREEEAAAAAAKDAQNQNAGKNQGAGFTAGSPAPAIVDKVGKVGKIEKPVEISKDDLKIMRDVAEMKNIQNFVTLTPTVQVKTGPVTNQANVDSIVTKITKKLNEEVASSAQGVYSG